MSPGYLDTKDDLLDSEGYFHTGDMGYYDKDGIIHFVEQVGGKSCKAMITFVFII